MRSNGFDTFVIWNMTTPYEVILRSDHSIVVVFSPWCWLLCSWRCWASWAARPSSAKSAPLPTLTSPTRESVHHFTQLLVIAGLTSCALLCCRYPLARVRLDSASIANLTGYEVYTCLKGAMPCGVSASWRF